MVKINPLYPFVLFLYPLKTSENQRVSDGFLMFLRGIEMEHLAKMGNVQKLFGN